MGFGDFEKGVIFVWDEIKKGKVSDKKLIHNVVGFGLRKTEILGQIKGFY